VKKRRLQFIDIKGILEKIEVLIIKKEEKIKFIAYPRKKKPLTCFAINSSLHCNDDVEHHAKFCSTPSCGTSTYRRMCGKKSEKNKPYKPHKVFNP
jgi:hypothetical protein